METKTEIIFLAIIFLVFFCFFYVDFIKGDSNENLIPTASCEELKNNYLEPKDICVEGNTQTTCKEKILFEFIKRCSN